MPKKKRIEKWIVHLPSTDHSPEGYQLVAQIKDQWGDLRKIRETFRTGRTDRDLRDARERKAEIETNRYDVVWLRKEFPTTVTKFKGASGVKALFERAPTNYDEAPLQTFVELGLTKDEGGKYEIDPSVSDRGYLRRVMEDTSAANASQKRGIWSTLCDYGEIHGCKLDELRGEAVDDFVRWMESQSSDGKPRYAKSTIRGYQIRNLAMSERIQQR